MAVKPKLPGMSGGKDDGQITGPAGSQKFAKPGEPHPRGVSIIDESGMKNDIGEKSGFTTGGYIDKKGTQFGESVKFNHMPPGMDIEDQETVDIRAMPKKHITETSYPGDGWE